MKIASMLAMLVAIACAAPSAPAAGISIPTPITIVLPTPAPVPTIRPLFTRVTSLYIGLEEMQWVEEGLTVDNLTVYNYRTNREYPAVRVQNYGLGLYQVQNAADFIVGDVIYIDSWGSSNAQGYERYSANAHRVITQAASFFSVTVPFVYLD